MAYTIGEMAKRLGVPASTLRYYDKEGLLPFVERSAGGIRVFRESDFEWLRIIECLKKTGMSIKNIREYIELARHDRPAAGAVPPAAQGLAGANGRAAADDGHPRL